MAVNRVVANIATEHIDAAKFFYGDLLGMAIRMDHGWIITFVGSDKQASGKLRGQGRIRHASARPVN